MEKRKEETPTPKYKHPYAVIFTVDDMWPRKPYSIKCHHLLRIVALDEKGRVFDRFIKRPKPLSPKNQRMRGISNEDIKKGSDLKTVLKAFKRFLGCRRVVGWGLIGQFDLIRYYGERNGIFFNNVLVNVFEENEIVGGIKREKTPDGKIKSTSYLNALRITEKAYLRGTYYDGRNTYFTMPGGDDGMEVGHGDLRESSRGFLSGRLVFRLEGFIGYMSDPSSDLYKETACMKIIYELSDSTGKSHYFFSSLDKKNDPLFTGQFAINSEPDLAKTYKEKGLDGFKDWTYCVWEVFADTVNDEVVKDYLAIYKHQGFVF